ncbi:Grap2/cyclin-D-interacting protein [Rhizoctonia solani 123E]|uniref:Grap2/cyclin-D-interacting protein n=1 Tax=Rhizoctonia solani 123E TaxID=1423351 RepID=A0A074SFY6_9AGAM|nr:Grap2/cyclin-D-interacting protein [Rhizoctonia solani 123E]
MSSNAENAFKTGLQQAIFSCATSLDALKASRTQAPQIPEDKPSPEDVRSDFISILTLLYARSTSLTLVLNAGSYSAVREPLTEITRDVTRLAHCAGLFIVSGPTIRSEATWAAEEVINCIQTYLISFTRSKASATPPEEAKTTLMLRVGSIHNTIDRIKTSFSVDNRVAVIKRWQSDASHLDDAMREVKEMIEEAESDNPEKDENDFDDGWGEILDGPVSKLAVHEVEAAKKVMLILRMVALLHKRILSRIISPTIDRPVELEQLLAFSTSLAAGVDDTAASLWSPQDSQQIAGRTTAIQKKIQDLRGFLTSSEILPSEPQEVERNASSHIDKKDTEWFHMCFAQIDKAVKNTNNA